MAQLDPSRYKRLTKPMDYGVSDGIYWDSTNNEMVVVIDDTVKFKIPLTQTSGRAMVSDGTDIEPTAISGDVALTGAGAVTATDLTITSEARGDILRRGASAWERVSAKDSAKILIGDGTDVVSVAVSGDVTISAAGAVAIGSAKVTPAMLAKPRLRCVEETLTAASLTDGGAAVGTKNLTAAIPAGALFLYATVDTITGFAGDVSATITLGDGSDVDRYNTGTPSVFATAAAGVALGAPSGTAFHATAVANIVATVTSNADITPVLAGGGSCNLKFWFLEPI